jgi:arginine exporter protein ArgO
VGEALLSGLVAGYGVAVPVGAIAVLVLGLSARTSLAVGFGAALGVATADGLYALVAVVGGAAVAGLVRPVATPLRWVAAGVLLGLAARTAVVAWRHHRDPTRPARAAVAGSGRTTPVRAYLGLLGLTLLNPATVVYFSALVLGRQAGVARSPAASAVFVLAAFAASASWQLLLAVGGSAVGRVLTGPRGRLVTALVSSGLIALLAAGLLLSH